MITGAHAIIDSKDAAADRAFLREVLGFPHVDVGGGWLIFGLPPTELAVHPAEKNDVCELYLLCDNIDDVVAQLTEREVVCGDVEELSWGFMTRITLPGGGTVPIYQPRHQRPPAG